MKRKLIIAFLVLGVLGIGVEYWILYGSSGESVVARPEAAAKPEGESAFSNPEIVEPALADVDAELLGEILLATADSDRSPFQSRSERNAEKNAGLPRLTGTLISNVRRVAWLNGIPRTEGEPFDGFQIEEVEKDRVHLSRQGVMHTVELTHQVAAAPDEGSDLDPDTAVGEDEVLAPGPTPPLGTLPAGMAEMLKSTGVLPAAPASTPAAAQETAPSEETEVALP